MRRLSDGRRGHAPVRFYTTSGSGVVTDVMKTRGWKETKDDLDWDIFFADVHSLTQEAGFEYGRLREGQRVNHFPRHVELTRKDLMVKNLKRARRQLEKEGRPTPLDFFPTTYTLPQEYGLFCEEFRKTSGAPWIMKPCGRAQGKGIFFINKLSQVLKWQKDLEEKEERETYRDVYVVSKYIQEPFLISDRKFDIRLYVLVLSFTPLRVYIYRGGFCRFSRENYSSSQASFKVPTVHLTNTAVQRQEGNVGSLKWPLRNLRLYLTTQIGRREADAIFEKIQEIVTQSLLAVQNAVTQDKHCFEIYGYDVLLDRDLKPWLIEVNASPSLQTDSQEDRQLKCRMVNDALTLVDLEGRFGGRLPVTCGGFDVIYDQGMKIRVEPSAASLLGCCIPQTAPATWDEAAT